MTKPSAKYYPFLRKALLMLFIVFMTSSCIFVKVKEAQIEEVHIDLIQKPQIEMNEDALRSGKGDMITLIPKNWFFIDLAEDTPRDVFAIAVNPQYTLSIVFSGYQTNDVLNEIYSQQKLIGIANSSFDKKQKRAGGSLIKQNKISTITSANLVYVVYNYRTKSQPLFSQNAVFKSSTGMIYEICMIPMNLSGYSVPAEADMEKIFLSVLATVRY
jgi:hypothetical protein